MQNAHSAQVTEVLGFFRTGKEGLTEAEANSRLQTYSLNEFAKEKIRKWPAILAEQFKGFLVLLLFAAALISAALGEFIESGAILFIILLTALMGFAQEYRAEKAMEKLEKLCAPTAKVIRGGRQQQIQAKLLVPGDIVALEAGDIVPADCRIIEEASLQIDESSLTGESVPSKKMTEELPEDCPIADRENMAFSGTIATYGKGVAVVVATGQKTEFGKIAETLGRNESKKTALEEKFESMARQIGGVVIAIAALVFVAGLLQGNMSLHEMLVFALSLVVASVPNALPAVVTISLAIGAQELAKGKMIVRKLDAIQNLGQATVICSDKTGTITKNEMTAVKALANGEEYDITGAGYAPIGEIMIGGKKSEKTANLNTLAKICAFCNNSTLAKEDGTWKITGDPTEASLLVFAQKTGFDFEPGNKNEKILAELPFDSERKLMTVVIREKGGKKLAFVKGAPDILLKACAFISQKSGKARKMTDQDRKEILATNSRFANSALRVLGFACREITHENPTIENTEKNLTFVGLIGMIDPPREEVAESVAIAKKAGIRVVMITGDHAETAKAIARGIGIYSDGDTVLTGEELEKLDDDSLEKAMLKTTIIARALPIQKVRIIAALKKRGETVVMTGDGVNDAPALKKADAGISMGITGTDISKEVSAATIADDNFTTIISGIREGRNIYQKIMNFTRYLLSCNLGEITLIVAAVIANIAAVTSHIPLPLNPLQILMMNLLTDGLPAIGLGLEKSDPEIMKAPPIKSENPLAGKTLFAIIGFGLLMGAGSFIVYFFHLEDGNAKAQTVAFTTLVMFQLFAALGSRSSAPFRSIYGLMKNKWLLGAIGSSIALQIAVIYFAPLQQVFGTVPLAASDWIEIIAISSMGFLLMELGKFFTVEKTSKIGVINMADKSAKSH